MRLLCMPKKWVCSLGVTLNLLKMRFWVVVSDVLTRGASENKWSTYSVAGVKQA